MYSYFYKRFLLNQRLLHNPTLVLQAVNMNSKLTVKPTMNYNVVNRLGLLFHINKNSIPINERYETIDFKPRC